jgi:hypothetical protein
MSLGPFIFGYLMLAFAVIVVYPKFFLGLLAMFITGGILIGIAKIFENL